jgi:IMP dehydrogenase
VFEIIELGLSYDDVLLIPRYSSVKSRNNVSTKTKFSKNITLNIPIVSSNMATVTESRMAIEIARHGGIGIVHQFCSIEEQATEVRKVKRSTSHIIDTPITIIENTSLSKAKEVMEENNVTSLLVTSEEGKLKGILTKRDYLFENDLTKNINDLMTSRHNLITAKPIITLKEARALLHKFKIEKIPLINEDDVIKGLITTTDIEILGKYPEASRDSKGRLLVAAAVGVKSGFLERTKALIAEGVDVIVVDIAHGHNELAIQTIRDIKSNFNIEVVAGNIVTEGAARDLINAGVDGLKIGVGPGAACTTRITAGAGVPQITAIMNCFAIAKEFGIPICADGGIKLPGELSKAIAAGAHTIMCGQLLAGTDESPGYIQFRDGKRYKRYMGSSSYDANVERQERENGIKHKKKLNVMPEGVEGLVPYKGSVEEIIETFTKGLRSGMSYTGAHTIEEMHQKAKFIRITSSGMKESKPHDMNII